MKLSVTERWILSNQYRILGLLDRENADSHAHAQTVLEDGFELEYEWLIPHIYQGTDLMTADECREVIDILDLFQFMKYAYEDLDDKNGIDEWAVTFHGFSGNDEGKQMNYAAHLQRQGKFTGLAGADGLNSHFPMLQRYRAMVAKWREMDRPAPLSREQLAELSAIKR